VLRGTFTRKNHSKSTEDRRFRERSSQKKCGLERKTKKIERRKRWGGRYSPRRHLKHTKSTGKVF
jgi:hypothetical protein